MHQFNPIPPETEEIELPHESGSEWDDPEPLNAPDDPLPYPLEALPFGIREATEEVLCFTQAPPALVACSALSALSLAGQGLANVRRDRGLDGPVSLYFLGIAESGERKSTLDGHFTSRIREWEQVTREAFAPALKEYAADLSSWEAERAGLLLKIKTKSNPMLRDQLRSHEKEKPQEPQYSQPLHMDSTPEALAWSLAHRWPSGAVLSSEAGLVLGSHAMSKDSVVRNLALLNILWDGGILKIDRRTSGRFTVQGARLTIGLATQAETIREFFEASRGLARGCGFLARFLIAFPKTTQGTRFWKDSPSNWPNLTHFQNRLIEMLEKTPTPDRERGLTLPLLRFNQKGQSAWIDIYNSIEAGLAPDKELSDIKDLASKSADNVARLGALFALYENRAEIDAAHVERASRIIVWHLYEGKRFFRTLAASEDQILAGKLDAWLIEQKRPEIAKREIQKSGPNRLRKKEVLDRILNILGGKNRIKILKQGHGETIVIHPVLLKGGE